MDKKYDLEERTSKFSGNVIRFCKTIKQDVISKPIISQLVRSGTSVGANYCEADNASTKKDFTYKISICRKEAKETTYWLQMIVTAVPSLNDLVSPMSKEAHELNLIFSAIAKKSSEQ